MKWIEKHLTEFKTLLQDISEQLAEVVKLLKEIRDESDTHLIPIKDSTTWTWRGDTGISVAHGDITTIYDICGCMGLCQECRDKGLIYLSDGCQKHYTYATVRGMQEPGMTVCQDMGREGQDDNS